jgi:hypothetical protein
MIQTMPVHTGEGKKEDENLAKYDYANFMQRFMGPAPTTKTTTANGRKW